MESYFRDFLWRRPLEAEGIWYQGCYTNIYFNLRLLLPEGFHLMEAPERGAVLGRLLAQFPVEKPALLASDYTEAFCAAGSSGNCSFFVSVQDAPLAVPFGELFGEAEYGTLKKKEGAVRLGDVDFSLERVLSLDETGQLHFFHGPVGKHSFNILCFLEQGGREEYGQFLKGFDAAVKGPMGEEEDKEKMKEALKKEYRNLWMAAKLHIEPDKEEKEAVWPKEEYPFEQLTEFY